MTTREPSVIPSVKGDHQSMGFSSLLCTAVSGLCGVTYLYRTERTLSDSLPMPLQSVGVTHLFLLVLSYLDMSYL